MAQVTSGVVRFEDAIKKPGEGDPQYWLSKKAAVELSFSVDAGEDYQIIFNTVTQAATNRVSALLGTAPVKLAEPTGALHEPEPAALDGATPPKRKRRTAAEIAAAAGGPSTNGASGAGQTSDEDPTGNVENVIHLPDEAAIGEDDFSIEPEPETVTEESFDIEPDAGGEDVTDADLNNAVQKKNAEIANPNAIRALIGTYNPDPKAAFQLRQIPAAKRAEFLTKLGELKKAA